MKAKFFGLKDWQTDHIQEGMKGHDIEIFDKNIQEVSTRKIRDADIVGVFVFCKVDKDLLDKMPNLKLIVSMSTGYDHIDLEACKAKGIKVCTVPNYGIHTVAEFAFSLMLALTRNIHKAYQRTKKGKFSFDGLSGFDLNGKTLGVVGSGHIGLSTIQMANGFSMNVIAYDAYPRKELQKKHNFKYVTLDKLFKESDIISIHVPLLPSTKHMVNEERLRSMKESAILINTSRGDIVDTKALYNALKDGHIQAAGLDVLEAEKAMNRRGLSSSEKQMVKLNKKLMKLDNVLVTPHLAFYSREALERILDSTVNSIKQFIKGKKPDTLLEV